MRAVLPILAAALLTTGCSLFSGPEEDVVYTRFSRLGEDAGCYRCEYVAMVNEGYPAESEAAEKTRRLWLESYLVSNGWSAAEYRVVGREFGKGPEGRDQLVYLVEVAKEQ